MQILEGIRKQKISPLAATIGMVACGAIVLALTSIKGIDPNQILFIQITGGAALGQGFINYLYLIFRQDPNEKLLAKLDEQKLMLQQVLEKLNQSP